MNDCALLLSNIIILVILSMAISGIIIPKILLIAFRRHILDEPNERKIHRLAVPRLGGLAFLPVILFSCAIILGTDLAMGIRFAFDDLTTVLIQSSFSLCAFFVLYVVGIGDDLVGVRYRAKFLFQTIAAALVVLSGQTVSNLHGLFGIYELSPLMSALITMIAIVYIVNAINLIDGIDGLASGLAIAASIGYGLMAIGISDLFSAFLSFALVGTLIPFFYYNVFSEESKKIFMGDTGALSIGLMLSILAIRFSNLESEPFLGTANVFVVAFTPLVIPCFDVIRVMVHRIRTGRSPFLADKSHIHHKLMDAGLGEKKTMVLLVLASVILSFVNIYLSQYVDVTIVLLCNALLGYAFSVILTKIAKQKDQKLEGKI